MTEPPINSEEDADIGTPRWAKVAAAVLAIVVLLFVIKLVTSGTGHGPGRHGGSEPAASAR